MITIGSAKIATNVMLAPMSGHSDLPFRMISRECGAKFCFFEMLDAHCLIRGPKRKAAAILNTIESDTPIAAQILGGEADIMLRAARDIIRRVKISFLDINAACPVKKVIKKRAGSYLLHDRVALIEIVKKLAVSLPVPVTVKMRLGYKDSDLPLAAELAKQCESNGASAIFVHGRTGIQRYSSEVDYASIKAIKDALKIPVFGSGNIFDAPSAKKMFDLTGCDGILVARGALGNPFIFKEIESCVTKGEANDRPDMNAKKTILKKHLDYIYRYRTEPLAIKIMLMRKTALFYLKNFSNAAQTRRKVSLVKEYEKMLELIENV